MALSSPIPETAAKRALNIAQDAPTDDDTSPIAKRPLFAAGAAAPKVLFDDISSSDGGEDSDEGDDLFEADPSSNDRPVASDGASSIDIVHAREHRSGCRFKYEYTAIESPQKRQRRERSFPPPSPALHLSQSSTDAPPSSQGTPATPAIRRVTDIPGHYFNEDDDSDFDEIFDYSPTKFATSANDYSQSKLDFNKAAILHNDILIFARSDALSRQPPISENDASFRSFESKFAAQVHHKFTETRTNAESLLFGNQVGTTTRSSSADTVASDDDEAVNLETTNVRRLDRLMFEDIIRLQEGDAMKLYVSKAAVKNIHGWWGDSLLHAVKQLSLTTTRMHSRDFYDNVRKKRVGGRRRIARKLRLNRAISARMAVISASTIESTVPEDDGDEMVDHPWTVLAKKTSRFIN